MKTEKVGSFETVTGWIVGKTVAKEQVVLKLQSDRQQIRMIPLASVLKVSTLKVKATRRKVKVCDVSKTRDQNSR